MEKLKTATGKEFECDYLTMIESPPLVFIRILDESISTVATVFSNPVETIQLWFENNYIAQYTKLVSLFPEENTAVKVTLAKE